MQPTRSQWLSTGIPAAAVLILYAGLMASNIIWWEPTRLAECKAAVEKHWPIPRPTSPSGMYEGMYHGFNFCRRYPELGLG